ncbi:MAG: TMEM175 family protein [Gammaproteobacteria bacterium]
MTKLLPDTHLTVEQIDQLPVEEHFRLRGTETTRLDTLIDAAFAFTLPMLAIAQEGVPSSFDELKTGIAQLPALTLAFAALMMFWFGHRKWSRRYGIENTSTVIISVSLAFVLLIYIYPLRLLFEGMFSFLSGGRLPYNLSFNNFDQVRGFFAFYATGFLAMSLLMKALYHSALKQANALMLNEYELLETRYQSVRWTVSIAFALISIAISVFIPIQLISIAGFIFFVMMIFQHILHTLHKRKIRNL